MKYTKKVGLMVFIVAFFCCGCATGEEVSNKIGSVIRNDVSKVKKYDGKEPVSQPELVLDQEEDMDLAHGNENAEAIAENVLQLAAIKTASIVLIGNNAIVAINLEEDVLDEEIPAVKQEVETLVLSKMPELNRVSVTASPELMERVNNVVGQVGEGQKSPGVNEELNQILTRVIPTI